MHRKETAYVTREEDQMVQTTPESHVQFDHRPNIKVISKVSVI